MYYIIEKSHEIGAKLYQLRQRELEIDRENRKLIVQKIGFNFVQHFGYSGQMHEKRTKTYDGICFLHEDQKEIEKSETWILHNRYASVWIPNLKTDSGKKMYQFLQELPHSSNENLLQLLSINQKTYPYLEIGKDNSVLLQVNDTINLNLSFAKRVDFEEFLNLMP